MNINDCLTAMEKINKIKEIISSKNGIADNQEFGLTYCQAVDYLDMIEEVIKEGM